MCFHEHNSSIPLTSSIETRNMPHTYTHSKKRSTHFHKVQKALCLFLGLGQLKHPVTEEVIKGNPKSAVMHCHAGITQVHWAQKLDEISYLKTLSAWGVSVSITKPAWSKFVNWQLKNRSNFGEKQEQWCPKHCCIQTVIAEPDTPLRLLRALFLQSLDTLRGPLRARRVTQPPICH